MRFDELAAAISTTFGNLLTKQDILRHHALDPDVAGPTIALSKKAILGDPNRNPQLRAVKELMLNIVDFDEARASQMIEKFKDRNNLPQKQERYKMKSSNYYNSPSMPKYFSNWKMAKDNWINLLEKTQFY
ncbi:hypothetical protein [Erythrobacter ramosus]|nr:hypothetical protein [Erythrobacter ramosus]MXP38273.1 hypothetical protein [Erythrobacter ramosus]